MLKFEEICELVRLVGSTGVARVEIEHGGARVSVEGRPPVPVMTTVTAETGVATAGEPVPAAPPSGSAEAAAIEETIDGHLVPSPIVGTFYRAPNPDADPFVRVGDNVRVGQVLCIVEAMKLMNEIESDIDGTIVKVHVENAEPVEFGQPLFTIKPS